MLSEEDTKTEYINPALRRSGWYAKQNVRMEYPDKNQYLYYTDGKIDSFTGRRGERKGRRLDYLLYYPDVYHKLAVIEAKSYHMPEDKGMQQGLDYARDLHIPFVFTSNGHDFIFKDRLVPSEEQHIPLDKFPTKEQLVNRYIKEAHLSSDAKSLMQSKYYYHIGAKSPRYYQVNAINKTLEAVAKGKHHIMFVMATGTGKTYTAFQIVWRLMHAKNLKHPINKVLYLVDRRILAKQPMDNDFKIFKPHLLKRRDWSHSNELTAYQVFFGLYQQLFSGKHHDKDEQLYQQLPSDFFDLIVIDEAHRGSANIQSNWHKIISHFAPHGSHTIVVGMTATPNMPNRKYFGKPVYYYSLKHGINDGYLAPYNVIRVGTNIDEMGFTPYKGEKDVNGYPIPIRQYNTGDFDRTIVIPQRTMQVAKFVTDYLKKTDRNSKAIFFCQSVKHARRMRYALIHYNQDLQHEYDDDYVAQITSQVDNAQAELERFKAPQSKHPVLVTTSDMLRTGVNVKDIKLIVIDASINSMTEFKQIIGRGTRLDTQNGKDSFVIIDFRNATRKFSDPHFDGLPDSKPQVVKGTQDIKFNQNKKRRPSNDSDKQVRHVPRVNAHVYINDSYHYHFDKNGNRITDNILFRDKIKGKFHSLKDFIHSWNKADRKTLLLNQISQMGISISELRKNHPDLKDYDDFDIITHLAFDTPPLSKRDRVNKVKKQGVIYKYHGQARQVLEALLNKFQTPGIDVDSLESVKTLRLPEFTNKFGDGAEVVINDFGNRKNYMSAIRDIINSMYNPTSVA